VLTVRYPDGSGERYEDAQCFELIDAGAQIFRLRKVEGDKPGATVAIVCGARSIK
jgi:hypothetical protein